MQRRQLVIILQIVILLLLRHPINGDTLNSIRNHNFFGTQGYLAQGFQDDIHRQRQRQKQQQQEQQEQQQINDNPEQFRFEGEEYGKSSTLSREINRSLIVGGNAVASRSEYPGFVWQKYADSGCGGTLIHPDVVLTAAHCREVFEGRGLYIGGLSSDGSDGQFLEDVLVVSHPLYNSSVEENDIMLVLLESPSEAPLVKWNFSPFIPTNNSIVTVVGFGRMETDGVLSTRLLEVNITVFESYLCQLSWSDFQVYVNPAYQVCAGTFEGGKDSCTGDSGGPLFVYGSMDDELQQVGIVSYSQGCGVASIPGIYTRVSAYDEWIQQTICNISSVPPPYCAHQNWTTYEENPKALETIFPASALSSSSPKKPFHYGLCCWLCSLFLLTATVTIL